MPKGFREIDIDAVEKALRVDVVASPGDGFSVSETDIVVRPPLTFEEHASLGRSIARIFGRRQYMTQEKKDDYLKFIVDGVPSEAHRWYGVELAAKIIALRGIGAALVVSNIGDTTRRELILENSTPVGDLAVVLVH